MILMQNYSTKRVYNLWAFLNAETSVYHGLSKDNIPHYGYETSHVSLKFLLEPVVLS